MIKKLAEMKLLRYSPYHGVNLTKAGEKIALEVIRHHRLLELYLAEALGYSLDKVHDEAERLEHSISEEFEEKIDKLLGRPRTDPHGDPIPTKEGVVAESRQERLSVLEIGRKAVISRVSNQDPERLRYLASLGLVPKASVIVMEKAPFKGPLRLNVGKVERVIGWELADSIFVIPQAGVMKA